MSIEPILVDFALSKKPGALVLQGRWGVGKTFLWRYKVLPIILREPGKHRYSYVSLFGVESLDELKKTLAVATEESDQELGWFRRFRRWINRGQPFIVDAVGLAPRVGSGLSRVVEKFGDLRVRNRIICFDDVERRSDGLALKDFLGLVSYLVDQRRCRIVVILNTGELGESHQSVWDKMKEKVFDGELTFAPSLAEAIELGLTDSLEAPWVETMRQSLTSLAISNLRLIRRTVGFMNRAMEVRGIDKLRPSTVDHIAKALTMLVYSVHGQGEGAPPIERVMHRTMLDSIALGSAKEELSEDEVRWRSIVQGYGFYLHTPLDEALLAMVQAGYSDPALLEAAIDEIETNAALYDAKQAFYDAWGLYHHCVSENGNDLVAAFERTWPPVSQYEHAQHLEGMVRLLRLLGRADLATQFIENWVEERWGALRHELSPAGLHMLGRVEDTEILAAVAKAKEREVELLPLQAAYEQFQQSQGYPGPAIASFAAASDEAILAVIDANPGEDLWRTLKRLIDLPENTHHPEWTTASVNIERACKSIAARSPLNADRIKNWFGLEPLTVVPASGQQNNAEPLA